MAAARGDKVVDFQEYRRRRASDGRREPDLVAATSVIWGYAWVPMVMVYPIWPVV